MNEQELKMFFYPIPLANVLEVYHLEYLERLQGEELYKIRLNYLYRVDMRLCERWEEGL